MLTLYIVPTGETEFSPKGELLGINNPPLSLDGLKHAEKIGEILRPIVLEAVISGPLKREFVTARVIATPHNLPVRTDRNLRDTNYGSWSGKNFSALNQEEPKLMNKLKKSPQRFKFPSGEKVKRGWRRVSEFTYLFKLNYGTGNVVIIADDFISIMLMSQLTRTPFLDLEPWISSEGQMSVLKLEQGNWTIESLRGVQKTSMIISS